MEVRTEERIRAFLAANMTSEERLQRIVAPTGPDGVHPADGWIYDPDLGFAHAKARHSGDGVNGTDTFYDYEPDGARRLVNCADRQARIHTYGDSFTHCDQVNNGETWQEHLAAHLQEPIRNYGVGGYSVYQAYLRMKLACTSGLRPDYLILNIFDDDHYRNLVSWIRHAGQGLTRPCLRVDVAADSCVEHGPPIGTAAELLSMRDIEFLLATFGEDPLVYLAMALQSRGGEGLDFLEAACDRLGVAVPGEAGDDIEAAEQKVFTEAALFSSRKVVGMVEEFCHANRIRLMIVLSYGRKRMPEALQGQRRFDHDFVAWFAGRGMPIVDMQGCFKAEFEESGRDLDSFMRRYYIGGHHTPLGNMLTAWNLVDAFAQWLDPGPDSYRHLARAGGQEPAGARP